MLEGKFGTDAPAGERNHGSDCDFSELASEPRRRAQPLGVQGMRAACTDRHKVIGARSTTQPCVAGIMRGMFVVELIYKAPLADIDKHMAAHVRFLKKYYAAGNFLVSGRKIPRDGGIILAVASSRDAIEAIVREDPFHTRASRTSA